jgi:hypothetical protein
MRFKEFLELEESFTELGSVYGPYMAASGNPVEQAVNAILKVEKMIGMRKFLTSIPLALYAKVMFVIAAARFIKNPMDKANHERLLKWLAESVKLSVYTGASIPLAMAAGAAMAPGVGEWVAGLVAKGVSYGYFYLGQWAEQAKDNPKYADLANRIIALLPQTISKK